MTIVNPVLSRRRSTVEIVFAMLQSCSEGGVTKTSIMYHSHLNHEQLQRYLSRLAIRGLIDTDNAGHFYLTEQGEEAFEQVSSVISMLRDLGKDVELVPAGN